MKCPVCKDINLVMATREGIEIDYCPECRGVWLDRGELDKIIQRSTEVPFHMRSEPYGEAHHRHGTDYNHYKKKKYKSFLGELFDF